MMILKKPLITEKMTKISEKLNRYGFIVDERANKGSGSVSPMALEFLMVQHFGLNTKKLANVDRKNLKRVPLPLPSVTGARHECVLGAIYPR